MSAGPSSWQPQNALQATHNVHAALAPRIAVLSSPDVDEALAPNGFQDFADLLRPFQDAVESVSVRTSQLETRVCSTFPLSFDNLDNFAPSSPASSSSALFTPADAIPLGPKGNFEQDRGKTFSSKRRSSAVNRPEVLLDAISSKVTAKAKASSDGKAQEGAGNVPFQEEADISLYRTTPLEHLTPWFAETRDMVFRARSVSEHETFGHPVAAILVVSASSTDPMNAFASLFEASQPHVSPAFSERPYVDPFFLRYYVLLHDVSKSGSNLSESKSLLETVKKTYGLHCCLLAINSADERPSDGLSPSKSLGVSDIWKRALQSDPRASMQKPNIRTPEETPPELPPKDGQGTEGRLSAPSHLDVAQQPKRWGTPLGIKGDSSQEQTEDGLTMTEESRNAWKESLGEESGRGEEGLVEQEENQKEYAALLNDEDVRRIKSFVRELASQNVVPFIERCVSLWNEQLAASRKGLTGRLFGAGRKLFSSGSPRGSSHGQAPTFGTLGYYPHASIEAQTRRLADFAFITRDYKLAASTYDLGRKDYANDKAYKYMAGANEMFGLSHLMIMLGSRSAPIDVDSYLANACYHYMIAPRRKGSALQIDSLRATLLYYEAYRALNYYRSAPSSLVRTASEGSRDAENDLEVAGAMLLEQAAISDARQSGRPALRKCALHLVMAAHRYRSCGQKHLSYRCFRAAARLYNTLHEGQSKEGSGSIATSNEEADSTKIDETEEESIHLSVLVAAESEQVGSWDLVNDHTEYQLAQQAFSDGNGEQAVAHFLRLLRRQSVVQQHVQEEAKRHQSYLDGFLTSSKYVDRPLQDVLSEQNLPMSMSLVDENASVVRTPSNVVDEGPHWSILQTRLDGRNNGEGKGERSGHSKSNTVTVNEVFHIDLSLRNPLCVPLSLFDLSVVIATSEEEALGTDLGIDVEEVAEIVLDPLETRLVPLQVRIARPGKARCLRVGYALQEHVKMMEDLTKHGRRLNETKVQRSSKAPMYAPDDTLSVIIHLPKPHLEVALASPPGVLGLGEEKEVLIELHNTGQVALKNARMVANREDVISPSREALHEIGTNVVQNSLQEEEAFQVPLPNCELGPGASITWPLKIRGATLGAFALRMMFGYDSAEGEKFIAQLEHVLSVEPVIDLAAQAGPSRSDEIVYDLELDAVNLCPSGEKVSISHVSILSPSWSLHPGQYSDPLAPLQGLESLQRRPTVLKLSRTPTNEQAVSLAGYDYTLQQIGALLFGRDFDVNSTPSPLKVHSSTTGESSETQSKISFFLEGARKEWRHSSLQNQFLSMSEADRRRIFTLYQPSDVDVVAHWTMQPSGRRGQAFVFGLQLGPAHDVFRDILDRTSLKAARTLYAEAAKDKAALLRDMRKSRLHMEEDPLILDVDPPKSTSHDFNQGRMTFPVSLIARNLSPVRLVDFTLQLDNYSRADTTLQASWVDRLTIRGHLRPHETARLESKASIHVAGKVELGSILVRTSIREIESEEVLKESVRWEESASVMEVVQSYGNGVVKE